MNTRILKKVIKWDSGCEVPREDGGGGIPDTLGVQRKMAAGDSGSEGVQRKMAAGDSGT